MASKGASAVLGPNVTLNPPFTSFGPLFPTPASDPVPGPPCEQPPPALVMSAFPPGGPLVRSAFPRTPQGVGAAGHGPSGAGTFNITVPVRTQGAPAEPSHTQTTVLAQAPLTWSAPGALCGGAQCPAPLLLAAPAVGTVMPAASIGGTRAGEGYWFPGHTLPAPIPAAQPAQTVGPGNDGTHPHGAGGEGGKAPSQAKAAPEDSCNPRSVYDNFRRWQRFKSLARGHLPQSPDAEALSCFLIPVLRSLARLKPTMSLEDGVRRAMQEWQGTSSYDRRNYYDMAAKFMELEAEEEMQLRMRQCVKGPQGLPPPAPPKLAPPGPPVPNAVPRSGCAPRKAGRRAPSTRPLSRRPHKLPQAKAPKEIPPEAVQEYVDITEALLGPHANWEGGDIEEQQEQDGTDPDPDLLSYINKLCSQEDFITKVEAIVHPRFLAALLSPDPNLDPLALTEVLEQEEGLTLAQLVEKRLVAPNEAEGVGATPGHGTPQLESHPKTAAGQGGERDDHGPQGGVVTETCPAEAASHDPRQRSRDNTDLPRPKEPALWPGHQESRKLRAAHLSSLPQGHRPSSPGLRGACPVMPAQGPAARSSEVEEDLPSLDFFLTLQCNLQPWGLSLSPVPALRPARPSRPQKRRGDPLVSGRRKQQHWCQPLWTGFDPHCILQPEGSQAPITQC